MLHEYCNVLRHKHTWIAQLLRHKADYADFRQQVLHLAALKGAYLDLE